MKRKISILIFVLFSSYTFAQIRVGAEQTEEYLPLLKGKRIALVVNQTSIVTNVHLLDTLLNLGINIKKVFAPEHGFRGTADAGEVIENSKDNRTGISLISIYGKNKKPSTEDLSDVDIVIFDIQDVGARFYTYISTLHYVMEACAENNKLLIVFDRPNPNDYVDGPVLKDKRFCSFVGIDPIPMLHGCTVGELALMINGERWLKNGIHCQLKVIPIEGWKHKQTYSLPIKPSPNLPNDRAIKLYPSLCLFEGTEISVGRGTEFPFQVIGYPDKRYGNFEFTPKPIVGMDTNPLYKDTTCFGLDLREGNIEGGLHLNYLMEFYKLSDKKAKFFSHPVFFDNLAGTDLLRKQIMKGLNEDEIRLTWQNDLNMYNPIRNKYLMYEE